MPIDPAVIPIPIIIPNSSNPWRPDGTLIKVVMLGLKPEHKLVASFHHRDYYHRLHHCHQ